MPLEYASSASLDAPYSPAVHRRAPARTDGISDYTVFGRVLRSELEMPDLLRVRRRRDVVPDWTLRVAHDEPMDVDEALVGTTGSGDSRLLLFRSPSGLRLEHSLHGSCTLRRDGRELVWQSRPGASTEMVRALIVGPALALAMQQRRTFCLHGSAVTIGTHAIAFLAPKGYGKSTMALALVLAGARLLSDDTLAVDAGPPALVWPGVHSIRVCVETLSALDPKTLPVRLVQGVKSTVTGFPDCRLSMVRVPLRAIYVLAPAKPGEMSVAAMRIPMSRMAASLALVAHAKLGDPLIGLEAAGRQLREASTVAERVPVYTLAVARELARLPEVVNQVCSWHRASAAPATHGGSVAP